MVLKGFESTHGLSVDRSLPGPALLESLAVLLVVDQFEVVRFPVRGDGEDVLDVYVVRQKVRQVHAQDMDT